MIAPWLCLLLTDPGATVLSLDQALATGDDRQPLLRIAAANTDAARARAKEALGGWLPSVSGSAALIYNQPLGAANAGAGTVLSGQGSGGFGAVISSAGGGSAHTTLGITANQLLYDCNQTLDRIRAAAAAVRQYKATEAETQVQTHQTIRSAYYNARAEKALLEVAQETLDNENKHLDLTEKEIKVGAQPEIALATEKANHANDAYQVINARGTYATGRSLLNQAMGVEGSIDYEVLPLDAPPVAGEDRDIDALMEQALRTRPAYLSLLAEIDFQRYTVASYKENLLPNLFGEAGLLGQGTRPSNLSGSFFAELGMSWPLFNFTNISDIGEQRADLVAFEGQLDQLRQQIRVDVDTARLQVVTYLSSVQAADEAVVNTHEQLRLAERRYQVGAGSYIELGDAQVAYTNAEVQRVQAQYNLNNARATLLAKLGQG